jgi:hypothetical protein
MLVKEYYPHFSESLMLSWSTQEGKSFKVQAYAFWVSVRDLDRAWICFDEQLLLDKIQGYHDSALGGRRGTIAYKRQR